MVYYTPSEVAKHNTLEDCWLIVSGRVLDLSPLLTKNRGSLIDPIVSMAGRDISHWFDAKGDIKTYMDPLKEITVPYLPMGMFLGVPPMDPTSEWDMEQDTPWWRDEHYVVGTLSRKTRKIKLVNTLTSSSSILEVCEEHTIQDIQEKYKEQNSHCESYTWKTLQRQQQTGESSKTEDEEGDDLVFVKLDMDRTLQENGLVDESDDFEELGVDEQSFLPEIFLYFNDDLTEA